MTSPPPLRLLACLVLWLGALDAQSASRVVVVVRHAEKQADGTRDPSLTDAGRARAEALAAALSGAQVTAVVTSPYARTLETGRPTAAVFALEPTVAAITREGGLAGHVASVTESVHAAPEGVVLVVGHSNTVPRIVEALGGPAYPDLAEDDHSSLFTLVLHEQGPAWCLRSELPAPSEAAVAWDVTDPCPSADFPPQEISPYLLPYPVGEKRNVRQGNCNEANSHHERFDATYAYDFEMPIGSKITASRGGTVLAVREEFSDDQHELAEANLVAIDHGDGTYAGYGHLTRNGALVEVGDRVVAGQVIALSGNSGRSRGPHLHFSVKACPEGERIGSPACTTVPVTFRNTRPHPRGLIGSASSALGGGEWYEALPVAR